MGTVIREKRVRAGLTLRAISSALGKGFSQARISLGERSLADLSVSDQVVILEAIERLAPLEQQRRRIIQMARDVDFSQLVADERELDGPEDGALQDLRRNLSPSAISGSR
jgi:hypothetical protein